MMYYITLALMVSVIVIIFTLTACVCTMMVALTRKLIHTLCKTREDKETKIIEVSNKRAKKTTDKPTENKKDA